MNTLDTFKQLMWGFLCLFDFFLCRFVRFNTHPVRACQSSRKTQSLYVNVPKRPKHPAVDPPNVLVHVQRTSHVPRTKRPPGSEWNTAPWNESAVPASTLLELTGPRRHRGSAVLQRRTEPQWTGTYEASGVETPDWDVNEQFTARNDVAVTLPPAAPSTWSSRFYCHSPRVWGVQVSAGGLVSGVVSRRW